MCVAQAVFDEITRDYKNTSLEDLNGRQHAKRLRRMSRTTREYIESSSRLMNDFSFRISRDVSQDEIIGIIVKHQLGAFDNLNKRIIELQPDSFAVSMFELALEKRQTNREYRQMFEYVCTFAEQKPWSDSFHSRNAFDPTNLTSAIETHDVVLAEAITELLIMAGRKTVDEYPGKEYFWGSLSPDMSGIARLASNEYEPMEVIHIFHKLIESNSRFAEPAVKKWNHLVKNKVVKPDQIDALLQLGEIFEEQPAPLEVYIALATVWSREQLIFPERDETDLPRIKENITDEVVRTRLQKLDRMGPHLAKGIIAYTACTSSLEDTRYVAENILRLQWLKEKTKFGQHLLMQAAQEGNGAKFLKLMLPDLPKKRESLSPNDRKTVFNLLRIAGQGKGFETDDKIAETHQFIKEHLHELMNVSNEALNELDWWELNRTESVQEFFEVWWAKHVLASV